MNSSAVIGLLASIGVAAVVTLLAVLVTKELATGEGLRLRVLGRNMDIVIFPLLFVFSFIVSMKAWEVIS
jgi:hypothetical protein